MRFAATLALPIFLAASALADCSCEPDSDWDDSPLFHPKPIKYVPKVTPTEQNIQQGVEQAVQGLTNQNVLPPGTATSFISLLSILTDVVISLQLSHNPSSRLSPKPSRDQSKRRSPW